MFEKVNPMHPDKIADRIAGAIVDLAYKEASNPRIPVEVLIGHGYLSIQGKRHSSKDQRVELFSFNFNAEIRNHHLLLCNHIHK